MREDLSKASAREGKSEWASGHLLGLAPALRPREGPGSQRDAEGRTSPHDRVRLLCREKSWKTTGHVFIRRLNRSPCCVTVKGNMKVVPSSKFSRGWHKIHRIVVLGWWKKCNYTVLITLTKHPIHWGGFRKEWSSKPLSMNTPGFLQIRCIHMHTRDKLTTWDEMIMVFKTNYSICCLYLKLKGATGGWFPALIFVLKSYSVDL